MRCPQKFWLKQTSRRHFTARLPARGHGGPPRSTRPGAWVNANRAEYLWYLCNAQKEWAQDVWEAKPPGARTKH